MSYISELGSCFSSGVKTGAVNTAIYTGAIAAAAVVMVGISYGAKVVLSGATTNLADISADSPTDPAFSDAA